MSKSEVRKGNYKKKDIKKAARRLRDYINDDIQTRNADECLDEESGFDPEFDSDSDEIGFGPKFESEGDSKPKTDAKPKAKSTKTKTVEQRFDEVYDVLDKVGELFGCQGAMVKNHTMRLEKVEGRLDVLEAASSKKSTVDTKTVESKNEPKEPEPLTKKPEPQAATKVEEPKKQPEANPRTEEPKRSKCELVKISASRSSYHEGPELRFKYWDWKASCWKGPKRDLWAAKAAGNGTYEPVWVWLDANGELDHIMSPEEIEKYCP
ncbi:hypothetical protein IKF30_00575 [Candidatus Saccharibacteria bacterium]|nr:hypothetical protein [Candidatus Saccharibacteria bacterium]